MWLLSCFEFDSFAANCLDKIWIRKEWLQLLCFCNKRDRFDGQLTSCKNRTHERFCLISQKPAKWPNTWQVTQYKININFTPIVVREMSTWWRISFWRNTLLQMDHASEWYAMQEWLHGNDWTRHPTSLKSTSKHLKAVFLSFPPHS